MEPVIATAGLVKRFGSVRALDGLDLSVGPGELHGFLGPNGSGKTTTLRVILGLLRADAGEVRLLGGDPWRDAVGLHRRVAYVPGDVDLWPKLTGGEMLDLYARLRGGADEARRDELIGRFELDPSRRSRTYSKGNRQKVALIAALASPADLLILDEPTTGLDPLMEAVFHSCLKEARDQGRTVLLSSHILAEVDALCDRVSILRAGRTIESGTLETLRRLSSTSITAETTLPPVGLEGLASVRRVEHRGMQVSFEVNTPDLHEAITCLTKVGLRALNSHQNTLEDLFLRHYGDDLADRHPADETAP